MFVTLAVSILFLIVLCCVVLCCSLQIRAGFRCISCSRQAHLAHRLQICRAKADGLFSDATATAKARTAKSRRGSGSGSGAVPSGLGVGPFLVAHSTINSRVRGSAGSVGGSNQQQATLKSHSQSGPALKTTVLNLNTDATYRARDKSGKTITPGYANANANAGGNGSARRTVSLTKELRL